jgi:hypothetical protein
MAAICDTHHISPECDLRTGCEASCQRNVHKPRLIPLPVAAVVQIHALWCALSLPPRLRRYCHQSRPTAQLAADRAVEEPCPTRSNLRANTQSPNRANVLRFLASRALGTCDFSPDVARFMQNGEGTRRHLITTVKSACTTRFTRRVPQVRSAAADRTWERPRSPNPLCRELTSVGAHWKRSTERALC